jgi:hypothetical protein
MAWCDCAAFARVVFLPSGSGWCRNSLFPERRAHGPCEADQADYAASCIVDRHYHSLAGERKVANANADCVEYGPIDDCHLDELQNWVVIPASCRDPRSIKANLQALRGVATLRE